MRTGNISKRDDLKVHFIRFDKFFLSFFLKIIIEATHGSIILLLSPSQEGGGGIRNQGREFKTYKEKER